MIPFERFQTFQYYNIKTTFMVFTTKTYKIELICKYIIIRYLTK